MDYSWDKLGYCRKYYDNEVVSELRGKLISKIVDKEFGFFYGQDYINNTEKNTHINKKCVQISMANQDDFDKVLDKLSSNLCGISFFKCPRIFDYTGLERFSNLKCVTGYWNNSLKKMWDASKTPKLTELDFSNYNKLDCAMVEDFKELKYFGYEGVTTTMSFDFLYKLEKLEQLWLNVKVLTNDIRPILSLKNLKNYFVGDKNHKYIEKYLKDGTLSAPSKSSIYNDMPTVDWLENESTSMNKKQIKQIERILINYSNAIATAENAIIAIEGVTHCVCELNKFSEFIETVEREELFEYLVSKGKDEWYDGIVEGIENTRDW